MRGRFVSVFGVFFWGIIRFFEFDFVYGWVRV